jgi:hypothetical protein
MHDTVTTIIKATQAQAGEIYALLMRCKEHLAIANVFQWTDAYPTPATVMQDIDNDHLYCLMAAGRCAGVITINQVQDEEYATVPPGYRPAATGKRLCTVVNGLCRGLRTAAWVLIDKTGCL